MNHVSLEESHEVSNKCTSVGSEVLVGIDITRPGSPYSPTSSICLPLRMEWLSEWNLINSCKGHWKLFHTQLNPECIDLSTNIDLIDESSKYFLVWHKKETHPVRG